MKTLLMLALMTTSLSAASADLTQRFAQCAGRMSAEMEFAWLVGRAGTEAQVFRAHLEDLIDAVAAPGEGPRILNLRVEAKHAHARLLTRSLFNDDATDALRAARLATSHTNRCRALLTG